MLVGKLALVTGCARGRSNGRAIALSLAKAGANVAVADILIDQSEQVAKEIRDLGRSAVAVKMDIGNYDEVQIGFQRVVHELGSIDILVNNAAITTNFGTIKKMDPSAWDKEISVNLSGAFYCIKQVFQSMADKKWGRIISISSIAGIMGGHGQCSYSASKAGLIGLMKTVALEGARYGITANTVTLGAIGTDAFHNLPDDARKNIISRIALKKEGDPEDVGSIVTYLSSDGAKYITGANILVTGGADLIVF